MGCRDFFAVCLLLVGAVHATGKLGYPAPLLGETSPGSVWPQPHTVTASPQLYTIDIQAFRFEYLQTSQRCHVADEAFKRYQLLISRSGIKAKFHDKYSTSVISVLPVMITGPCEDMPSLDMKEGYILDVGSNPLLNASSVWGVLRGLETFSQMIWEDPSGQAVANKTHIIDEPRYAHRGLLLDTARHFLPVNVILENLEAMAYNKFNVFHWHIVDAQSFPYVSTVYPNLHLKGSYSSLNLVYTPEMIAQVIEFARLRGIRVVPEFDTPGHTYSWGLGQPGLLTTCYTGGKPNGDVGPINPTVNSSYTFIKNLFTEVRGQFKDKYIHLGGDEVPFDCWKSNPNITTWMAAHNMSGDYAKLEQVYIQQVIDITGAIGFSYIVWQEVIDNGVKAKDDTVVEVWINNHPEVEMAKVTALGYRTILAAPWYLEELTVGEDWKKYYSYEPTNFNGTAQQKALVIGGEACLWGEYVDATNISPRLWPRASAVAERLWSPETVNDVDAATPRLHQHRCRMVQRGIPAEPLHPSYCVFDWMNRK
uniref:Beta-hexosaminidase n=1 Tax=Ciona intestinalis TaxID=7719 RepID=F6TSK2_CIOIN|nr:beta-hexosaminidase subunit alpha-like [Ciona intestinalis]|eukprot:XP_026690053.1 beta-hexosaminidase subunit alpha-like [Ciona intestinalis]